MKSITLLSYNAVERTITELAHDYNPSWMTSLETVDQDTFLGTEHSYNLFVLRRNAEAGSDEDETTKLECIAEIHVGEFINRFRHGSLVMKMPVGEGLNLQTIIYGTVNGSVGLVAALPKEIFQLLYKLQKVLVKVIKGVGGFNHADFRAFCSETKTMRARRFVDGDLIETFLDLSKEKMAEVVNLLNESNKEGDQEYTVDDIMKQIDNVMRAIY